MTDDRDPVLQRMFDIAGQQTYYDAFVDDVMAQINRKRRQAIIAWSVLAIALLPVAGLVGAFAQDVFQMLSHVLPSQLVESEAEWFDRVFAPVNTVGALVAFAFLGLRAAYRWIFA